MARIPPTGDAETAWLLRRADEGDLSAAVAAAKGPQGRWQRFAWVAVVAFLVAGVALASTVRAFHVWRYVPSADDAVALLETEPEPTVVFVGTSVTARGVIPEAVDEALAAAGCTGRSVNLAMGGASPEEHAWLVDAAAEQRGCSASVCRAPRLGTPCEPSGQAAWPPRRGER